MKYASVTWGKTKSREKKEVMLILFVCDVLDSPRIRQRMEKFMMGNDRRGKTDKLDFFKQSNYAFG